MPPYKPRRNDSFGRTPLFFKLWFAFVVSLVLCIFGATGFIFYTAAANPEAIGSHVGRMVGGAVEGFKDKQ